VNESEWLASDKPWRLLDFLGKQAGERGHILLCCACARRLWGSLADPRSRTAVDTAEAFADGLATEAAMVQAAEEAGEVMREMERRAYRPANGSPRHLAEAVADAAMAASWTAPLGSRNRHARQNTAVTAAANAASYLFADLADSDASSPNTPNMLDVRKAKQAEERVQAALLRDIFGNPFRPSPPLPPAVLAWSDRVVQRLAQAAYDERRLPEGTLNPSRLAILADALLDAGGEDESLLEHLRSPGPHVRGCWAVDAVLSRS
jgi:hypothetical protein